MYRIKQDKRKGHFTQYHNPAPSGSVVAQPVEKNIKERSASIDTWYLSRHMS